MFFVPGPYPPHVFGSTCFHGNIEDEWLVVHLLFALSRAQQQLVIRLVTRVALSLQTLSTVQFFDNGQMVLCPYCTVPDFPIMAYLPKPLHEQNQGATRQGK